jgi:hypothetical protein
VSALLSDVGLAVSRRKAARLLRIDRGATLDQLVRRGLLREIPWGSGRRIPLEDVERLAREGFAAEGTRPRRRTVSRRPGVCDPDALRRLDFETLGLK